MFKTEYGIQMYSLRDITKDSMRMALEKVSEMGYKSVQFAGFFDYTSEQIKLWLDTFGLSCNSTHTGLSLLTDETIDATIAYHKAIGCNCIVVPGCDFSNREKLDNVIETLREIQKKLRENGMTLGYHNHTREFVTNADGLVFEDELLRRTDIELEVDVFWLCNAGIDVFSYLESHKDRIKRVHLKDGIPAPEENRNYDKCHDGVKGLALGEGGIPIKDICRWCCENGVLMTVESEGLDPTGLEEIKRCIEYLKAID